MTQDCLDCHTALYICFRYKFNVDLKLRRQYITGAQGKAKTNVWGYSDEALKSILSFLLPRALLDDTDITQHTM